jgi:hypothetical protein
MRSIPLNRVLDSPQMGDRFERAQKFLDFMMQKQLTAEEFADYYTQRLEAPSVGPHGRKVVYSASESFVVYIRDMFDRYKTSDSDGRRRVVAQLGDMIGRLPRRY